MKTLATIFEKQLQVQQCLDDDQFVTLAAARDKMLAKLDVRGRLQCKLACGILERLIDR